MAQIRQNVCSFNKYGFCRFRIACRKQHIMEKCPEKDCEIKECSLRHPRICRYYRDIGYCKFGEWCLFNHDGQNLNEISKITKKLKTIEKKIEEKNEAIATLEKLLETQPTNKLEEVMKTVDAKVGTFENNLNTVKQ